MTARELYETEREEFDGFDHFLYWLTGLLREETGIDYLSFPDTEIDTETLEEVGYWL